MYQWVQNHRRALNQDVFQSYTNAGVGYRSYWFQYQDFYNALLLVSSAGSSITGIDRHVFYTGQDDPMNWEYGLVNIAAFLAHAMAESINKDACDEYQWDNNSDEDLSVSSGGKGARVDNHFAISNSCGQGGQNYQDYSCGQGEEHMQCDVEADMVVQATTSGLYPNAPPPLSCRPRTTTEQFTGYWDVSTAKEESAFPYENSFGRTDVEGVS